MEPIRNTQAGKAEAAAEDNNNDEQSNRGDRVVARKFSLPPELIYLTIDRAAPDIQLVCREVNMEMYSLSERVIRKNYKKYKKSEESINLLAKKASEISEIPVRNSVLHFLARVVNACFGEEERTAKILAKIPEERHRNNAPAVTNISHSYQEIAIAARAFFTGAQTRKEIKNRFKTFLESSDFKRLPPRSSILKNWSRAAVVLEAAKKLFAGIDELAKIETSFNFIITEFLPFIESKTANYQVKTEIYILYYKQMLRAFKVGKYLERLTGIEIVGDDISFTLKGNFQKLKALLELDYIE